MDPIPNQVGHSGEQQHPAHVEETGHHRDEAAVARADQLQGCGGKGARVTGKLPSLGGGKGRKGL